MSKIDRSDCVCADSMRAPEEHSRSCQVYWRWFFDSLSPDERKSFDNVSAWDRSEKNRRRVVLCNLCGLPCNLIDECDDSAHGLIECVVRGGYSSTPGNGAGALDDMTSYKFSLCEFCLDWLFTQCKIVPLVCDRTLDEDLPGDQQTWRPAAQRVQEDEWRGMKDKFFAEAERRRVAREVKR
jgi:hypothetical protein